MTELFMPLLSDFVDAFLAYSPRVIVALITLALGWVFGRVIGSVIGRIVGKIGWESAFRRTSVGRVVLRSGFTPASFFAALGKGTTYFLTIISALNLLAIPQVTTATQAFAEYLPNLVEGVVIFVVGLIFSDWVGELVEKGAPSSGQSLLLGGLSRVLLYFVATTLALAQMEIDVTILYIFAQAFAWSAAIAIGVGFGWHFKDKTGQWLGKTLGNDSEKATDQHRESDS